jgi:hypothetical protein
MRKRPARARVLRIGFCCRSEQGSRAPATTTAGRQDHKEAVLHCDRNLPHPATLRPARRNSDYGQPYDYLRESSGEITKNSDDFAGNGALPSRQRERGFTFLRAKPSFRATARPLFRLDAFRRPGATRRSVCGEGSFLE